jgi:AraC family ethanolamine operon transcriptional activator
MNLIHHTKQTLAFYDASALSNAVQNTTLDVSLIKPAPFRGELVHISLPNIFLDSAKYNSVVKSVGLAPKDRYILGINRRNDFKVKNSGLDLTAHQVLFYKPGDQVDLLSQKEIYAQGLAFDKDFFDQKIIPLLEPESLPKMNWPILSPNHQLLLKLNRAIDTLLHLGERSILDQFPPTTLESLEESFAILFAEVWNSTIPNDQKTQISSSNSLVKRIHDFMLDHAGEKIYLTDICAEFGLSERTLRYLFVKEYEVSPKKYLNRIKLNLVHQTLLKTDPKQKTITEIAMNFGFWHMGNFSAYYKNLFDESPSQTLQRTEKI